MTRNQKNAWLESICLKSFWYFSDQVEEKASLRTSRGYCLFFLSTKGCLRNSRKCLRRKGNGWGKTEICYLSLSKYSKNTNMLSKKFRLNFLSFPTFWATQRTQICYQKEIPSEFSFFSHLFGSSPLGQSDNYLLSEWAFDWSAD